MNAMLSIRNLNFSYRKVPVITDFSLDVEEGSFTTLLGSSGCGKTTILRLISGFLKPNSGSIEIDGKNQEGIPPNERSVGMVFQDYALFPHLTVFENIVYGLKIQRVKRVEREKIALDCAQNLGISEFLRRFPSELSGGQQQRVALARAIVLKPRILLMDEPLSSLDAKMRESVRGELKEIQRRFKITTVYVTHDREEALSLSDKIAVIDGGKAVQVGSPKEIYFEPKNRFAASFIARANFFSIGGKEIMVRPEWFSLEKTAGSPEISGRVSNLEFLGETTRLSVDCHGFSLVAEFPTLDCEKIRTGQEISLWSRKMAQI